jgi:hypothetical protein
VNAVSNKDGPHRGIEAQEADISTSDPGGRDALAERRARLHSPEFEPSIGSPAGWRSPANLVPHALESRGAETLAEIHKITGGGTDFAL